MMYNLFLFKHFHKSIQPNHITAYMLRIFLIATTTGVGMDELLGVC